ncbi:helix-turn-helix domain-containing protein [Caldicoprobacter algeriensis]|uniref:helix-turn-helix transcriptional regulator n=1 Tax=Caldicoprobacter algeriensis TaxID=699281 RepID=UPI00207AA2BE|nr:helix-turn-helix transcriptional regulator [Caldicoprobacter algeriensis]MCM8901295.1 helix-turn-helix domain-containing protein [Caldicoprobacter algeriensis]
MHNKYAKSEVAALIKEKRNAKKLTQKQLATLVGVDRTTISKIENGARPSIDNAKKIAQILGFNWTIFFNCTSDDKQTETA